MNAYWAFRLWWMNNVMDTWRQFKHDLHERVKSTKYSIKVGSWHKPCIECWGSQTSVKYGQEQSCRLGCDGGYQKAHFWMDMKDIFYPSQRLYEMKLLLTKGCVRRHPWASGNCLKGTLGCHRHRKEMS